MTLFTMLLRTYALGSVRFERWSLDMEYPKAPSMITLLAKWRSERDRDHHLYYVRKNRVLLTG